MSNKVSLIKLIYYLDIKQQIASTMDLWLWCEIDDE